MFQGAMHTGHGDRGVLLGLKVEDTVATMLGGWIGLHGAVWGRNSQAHPYPTSLSPSERSPGEQQVLRHQGQNGEGRGQGPRGRISG